LEKYKIIIIIKGILAEDKNILFIIIIKDTWFIED